MMFQRKEIVQNSDQEKQVQLDDVKTTIRRNFPESWIFDTVEGDHLE